jgi:hypothetical protein
MRRRCKATRDVMLCFSSETNSKPDNDVLFPYKKEKGHHTKHISIILKRKHMFIYSKVIIQKI